ncbi:MAG: (2Fe-2S)-binding protein [Tistlia sp.]|uniref:(2Fe-2S)-binding protein n=1 Tax=Tistlia sp. TaxID=3057121 RepID=UPI0034A55DB5
MINLTVNGEARSHEGDPSMPLLWYLRDTLGLTGAKYGCGVGLCGACTVHLEGEAVQSCLITLADASDKAVVTIEGLDPAGEHPVQQAWRTLNVPQCGFCQTGQIMQAAALVAMNPAADDGEITEAMSGNICRCGCYQRIHAAVRQVVEGA